MVECLGLALAAAGGAAWCSTSSAVEFDFIKKDGILCRESASTIIHPQRAMLRSQFPSERRLDSRNSEEHLC